jgi:hypothetical protein
MGPTGFNLYRPTVASRRLYSTGSMAMRSRLRHLSFKSTALRDSSASDTPSVSSDLMSAHCPRPQRSGASVNLEEQCL